VTRSTRLVAPLTVLVAGLLLVGLTQPRSSVRAADGGVVEIVQHVQVEGGVIERRSYVEANEAEAAIAESASGNGVAAQYNINPGRWAVSSMPVTVRVNTTLEAPRPPLTPAVQNAVDEWSSVSPTTFRFVLGPTTTAGPGLCDNNSQGNEDPHTDGVNVVTYVNLQPGFLGLTCSYQPNDAPNVQTEFDTELAYGANWGAGSITSDQYDLWSTVLHEMGHAAGMGHSCFSPSTCVGAAGDAAMNFALGHGQTKRSLTDDDRNGLRALYPLSGPTLPPPSPTPTPIPPFQHNFAIKVGVVARTQ
jgi:Matrixin